MHYSKVLFVLALCFLNISISHGAEDTAAGAIGRPAINMHNPIYVDSNLHDSPLTADGTFQHPYGADFETKFPEHDLAGYDGMVLLGSGTVELSAPLRVGPAFTFLGGVTAQRWLEDSSILPSLGCEALAPTIEVVNPLLAAKEPGGVNFYWSSVNFRGPTFFDSSEMNTYLGKDRNIYVGDCAVEGKIAESTHCRGLIPVKVGLDASIRILAENVIGRMVGSVSFIQVLNTDHLSCQIEIFSQGCTISSDSAPIIDIPRTGDALDHGATDVQSRTVQVHSSGNTFVDVAADPVVVTNGVWTDHVGTEELSRGALPIGDGAGGAPVPPHSAVYAAALKKLFGDEWRGSELFSSSVKPLGF